MGFKSLEKKWKVKRRSPRLTILCVRLRFKSSSSTCVLVSLEISLLKPQRCSRILPAKSPLSLRLDTPSELSRSRETKNRCACDCQRCPSREALTYRPQG